MAINIDDFIRKYERYFTNYVRIFLCKLPPKMYPLLRFDNTEDCYTNDRIINIGKKFLKGTDEDNLILEVLYFLGHEAQHILSSPEKYWKWGLEHGVETLASEMSRTLNGYPLKGSGDIEQFCKNARSQGYVITPNMLMKIVHHVFNSVEDGRIERIASAKNILFRDQMFYQRISRWQENEIKEKDDDFVVVLNQILTLATMSMYQKGYMEKYNGTAIDNLIDEILPYIKDGVQSRNCHGCAIACQSIFKLIAPMCLESCKNEELAKNLSKMSSDWQMSGGGSVQNDYHNVSNQEEEDKSGNENGPNSQFSAGSAKNPSGDEEKNSFVNNAFSQFSQNKGTDKIEVAEHRDISDNELQKSIRKLKEQAMNNLRDNLSEIRNCGKRKPPVIKEFFDNTAPITADILKKKGACGNFKFKENKQTYTDFLEMTPELEGRARIFAKELEKVFEAENVPKIENRTSGSFNTKDAYKLAIGELDFWQKEEEDSDLNAVAYFMCDNSGSMGYGRDSKRSYALESLAVIEEGFKQYMPLKIVAFQASGKTVIHDCIKNFDEIRAKNCSFNFMAQAPGGSYNVDGYSIRIATAELLKREEEKKILFVLSDGLPAYENGEADTALAAKEAREAGIIVVPIYFGECSCSLEATLNTEEAHKFAEIYQQNYIITVPEDIEKDVIRVLKRLVL